MLGWSNGLFGIRERREVRLIADRRKVEPLKSNKDLVKTKGTEGGPGFPGVGMAIVFSPVVY